MPGTDVISRQVTVKLTQGLHLSPISELVRCASQFPCAVTLTYDGRTADVKSVYDLMLLAAPCGAPLTLEARGEEAAAAVEKVARLFDGGFSAGHHRTGESGERAAR